jgi:hypothetical protein
VAWGFLSPSCSKGRSESVAADLPEELQQSLKARELALDGGERALAAQQGRAFGAQVLPGLVDRPQCRLTQHRAVGRDFDGALARRWVPAKLLDGLLQRPKLVAGCGKLVRRALAADQRVGALVQRLRLRLVEVEEGVYEPGRVLRGDRQSDKVVVPQANKPRANSSTRIDHWRRLGSAHSQPLLQMT